jgi:hypothetical protein
VYILCNKFFTNFFYSIPTEDQMTGHIYYTRNFANVGMENLSIILPLLDLNVRRPGTKSTHASTRRQCQRKNTKAILLTFGAQMKLQ